MRAVWRTAGELPRACELAQEGRGVWGRGGGAEDHLADDAVVRGDAVHEENRRVVLSYAVLVQRPNVNVPVVQDTSSKAFTYLSLTGTRILP